MKGDSAMDARATDIGTMGAKPMDMRALALDLLLEEERGTEYESRLLKSALDMIIWTGATRLS